MKKLPFLIAACLLFMFTAQAQDVQKGRGAATIQELGQAVFNALQHNQFQELQNYLPGDTELKVLKRRSSEDMRLLLERTTPDSIRQNMQRDFNSISEQAIQNTINWSEWQPTNAKTTRRDRKNPLLYRAEITLANPAGGQRTLLFEVIRIRGNYFLFKQMVFHPQN
ncbi:hypothetical protein I5M27_13750 [Adhaeribacter sp. BT258]|uniref:DUF4019 domain-containing protein n=1 Tax=Adhaeribacter terrigena TaxID=2793070 RepID=A0ABS1C3V9_9BACT|nr:hypothetical protein [Adhaeribacter terrigena]MBK0404054.1 hypothetical protein [Adhaeribacter terrigena]